MKLTIFSLLMLIMFGPDNEVERESSDESPFTSEIIELETDRDNQIQEDCRYQDVPIPHRDLSDFEILSGNPTPSNSVEQVEVATDDDATDSSQREHVEQQIGPSTTDGLEQE